MAGEDQGISTGSTATARPIQREQRIFLIYGVLAVAYLVMIFLVVGATVFGWLDRLLGVTGILIFLAGAWMAIGTPLRQGTRTAAAAWRRHRGAPGRRKLGKLALVAGGVVLLVGILVPRPITVSGPFTAAPTLSIPLTAPDSGVVYRVYVREGTRVDAGMPVLEIRDLELERLAAAARRLVDSLAGRESQARATGRAGEMARLSAERATAEARLAGFLAELRTLVLLAPSDGIVVTARPEELVGQWVGLGEHLLELGLPGSLELRIALADAGAGPGPIWATGSGALLC